MGAISLKTRSKLHSSSLGMIIGLRTTAFLQFFMDWAMLSVLGNFLCGFPTAVQHVELSLEGISEAASYFPEVKTCQ